MTNAELLSQINIFACRENYKEPKDTLTAALVLEIIQDSKIIYEEYKSSKKHWQIWFTVVLVDGYLVGYSNAKKGLTDLFPEQAGWTFDMFELKEYIQVIELKPITSYQEKND